MLIAVARCLLNCDILLPVLTTRRNVWNVFLKMQCMLLAGCLPRVLWPFAGVSCPGAEVLPGDIHVLPNIFSMAESDLILVLRRWWI